MAKTLRKALILQLNVKNIFNKNWTHFTYPKYKSKKNLCVNLLRKISKQYFSESNKSNHILVVRVPTQISVSRKDMIITDEKQILYLMSESFVNIIKS